jgi:hypothetical protein
MGRIKNINDIPGVSKALEEDSGLVTSDSDFELNAELKEGEDEVQTQNPDASPGKKGKTPAKGQADIRKDVTKTFKKMLTQNHNRGLNDMKRNVHDATNESTKYGGSLNGMEDIDVHSNMDIEGKYIRKK